MKNDEAVEKLVVPVYSLCDMVPSFSIDGAAVKQSLELVDTVSYPLIICADGCPKALHGFSGSFVVGGDLERLRKRPIIERWKWG